MACNVIQSASPAPNTFCDNTPVGALQDGDLIQVCHNGKPALKTYSPAAPAPTLDLANSGFDPNTGIFSLCLSDGTCNDVDLNALFDNINATPGLYVPDTNGIVTIPLTDGSGDIVIDTPQLSSATAVANPDGTITLVMMDDQGNALATTTLPTTAEKFLEQPTLAGNVITFPMNDGTSYNLTLPDIVDNGDGTFTTPGGVTFFGGPEQDDTMQPVQNPDGSISLQQTDIDGNPVGAPVPLVHLDETVNDLGAGVTVDSWGLSAGQLALPIASTGVSNADDLVSVEAQERSASPISVASSLFNSGLTGQLINGTTQGVRNENGSLGNFSLFTGTSLATALNNNGAFVSLSNTTGARLPVIIPDGKYPGHKLTVYFGGSNVNTYNQNEFDVTVTVTGSILRKASTKEVIAVANELVEARVGESWDMVWDGNTWRVNATFNQYKGSGYRENLDGTYSVHGVFSLGGTTDNVFVLGWAWPFAVANPASVHVQMTDITGRAGIAIGDPMVSNEAGFVYVYNVTSSNSTNAVVGYQRLPNVAGNPANINYSCENVIRV